MDANTLHACPECGTPFSILDGDLSANSFCKGEVQGVVCDYPLFWAPTVRAPVTDERVDGARQRLPGVSGQERDFIFRCPKCKELNDPDRTRTWRCVRCRAELYPLPPPTLVVRPLAPPVAVVIDEPEPEPIVAPPRVAWWVWAAAALVAAVEVALVVLSLR